MAVDNEQNYELLALLSTIFINMLILYMQDDEDDFSEHECITQMSGRGKCPGGQMSGHAGVGRVVSRRRSFDVREYRYASCCHIR